MTLRLLETAVDVLSVYLQTNYTAKVIDLNVRYPDIILVNPVKWYLGNMPISTPEQPSICIHAPEWTPLAQYKDGINVHCKINLIVFIGGDNLEKRFRKLCRHALGLIELCHAKDDITADYNIKIGGTVTITDPMDTQSYLQAIIIPLIMEWPENY